ncbi:gluconate 2-dehydrogenase subunit 3 family protein [Aquiflexum lacus]|uniref:gluconate 2-dehydrogenase subunit 3 family protein n=1 Tax=Aquiflexum lacus TaxID=2483805 RepID=UPI0018959B89|nr:gluconate 2-dehydrogenase subunit 3 family protein [Aquiflexum lacus]
MKRRDALRSLALLTGGLVLVPSCDFSKEDILGAYQNLEITPTLKQLLAEIADTIIPAGNLKGAADIEVQDFILVMVNDCMEKEAQQIFMSGLKGFDDFSKKSTRDKFEKLSQEQRETLVLEGLSTEDESQQVIKNFLRTTKRFTIQGFMVSEYMQTEVKPYSLIPGEYKGDVLIAELKPERING